MEFSESSYARPGAEPGRCPLWVGSGRRPAAMNQKPRPEGLLPEMRSGVRFGVLGELRDAFFTCRRDEISKAHRSLKLKR